MSALGAQDNQLMLGIGHDRSDQDYTRDLPARKNSDPEEVPAIKTQFITKNMNDLSECIKNDSP